MEAQINAGNPTPGKSASTQYSAFAHGGGQPRVTVLVPAYNAERTLRLCLETLSQQRVKDAEFICINDGSTDGTLQIMRLYAQLDSRFVVLDKTNTGYGSSMNLGLAAARGLYVGVLESDDYMEPNTLEMLLGLASAYGNPDIVKANHYRFLDDGDSTAHRNHEESFVENYPPEVCGRLLCPGDSSWECVIPSVPAIWAALYRRAFLEESGIRFRETPGASFQDTGFVFKAWAAASSAIITHHAFVHYRFGNEGSSTISAEKAFCVCDEWKSIEAFASALRLDERIMRALARKKLQTYEWNLRRLKGRERLRFSRGAAEELLRDMQANVLQPSMLLVSEQACLEGWLANPVLYARSLDWREAKRALKKTAYRFLGKRRRR